MGNYSVALFEFSFVFSYSLFFFPILFEVIENCISFKNEIFFKLILGLYYLKKIKIQSGIEQYYLQIKNFIDY